MKLPLPDPRWLKRLAWCLLPALLLALPAGSKGRDEKKVPEFSLREIKTGDEISLSRFSGRVVVLAFFSSRCLYAAAYGQRIRELAAQYPPEKVQFLGINPGRRESRPALEQAARDWGWQFPVLKDAQSKVSVRLGVKHFPEVIVLDGSGVIRYRGRIDDQLDSAKVTRRYLAEALAALVSGKKPESESVPAFGCPARL